MYLSFFSHFFSFILWSAGTAKSTILHKGPFFVILVPEMYDHSILNKNEKINPLIKSNTFLFSENKEMRWVWGSNQFKSQKKHNKIFLSVILNGCTSRSRVLGITLNYIWWWGSSSGDLGRVEYLVIVITPRSTFKKWLHIDKINPFIYFSNLSRIQISLFSAQCNLNILVSGHSYQSSNNVQDFLHFI